MEKENELLEFGRYQKLILLLIGAMSMLSAMAVFSLVFTDANPGLICNKINETINLEENTCDIWKEHSTNNTIYECKYDTQNYGQTIVTEWDLICSKEYMAALTQTIFLAGTFSAILFGYLSDTYGRKNVSIIFLAIFCSTQIIAQFLQFDFIGLSVDSQYVVYTISKFILGSASNGFFTVGYTLIMELTPARKSTFVSNFVLCMFVVGELVIGLVAFLSRSWIIINWFIAGFALILLILFVLFLPESPKYLIDRRKNKELEIMMMQIAKFNRKVFTISSDVKENTGEMKINEDNESKSIEKNEESEEKTILTLIFKTKGELKKIIFISFIWFSLSMTYYGVSLGITRVGNIDPYLIYTLSSISEFIGYLMCYINEKFGLKRTFIWFLGVACLTCLAVAGVQYIKDDSSDGSIDVKTILLIVFPCFGKAFASAAFNMAYIYTSKMFSTRVRSTCLLFVSCMGRIGSVISPQINLLGDLVYKQLPYLIFSFVSFVGCIFIFILPDPSLLNNF